MKSDISTEPGGAHTKGAVTHRHGRRALVLIGAMNIVQGLLLASVAIGGLELSNKSVCDEAAYWLYSPHVDMDSPWVNRPLDPLAMVDNHQLKTVSLGSGIYALVNLAEGTGLALQKAWGEYFTILVTASFLPFEIYECFHHFRYVKLAILLINAAVLVYLVVRVRHDRAAHEGT